MKANGVVCNSCKLNQDICPANSTYYPEAQFVFDCTNTIMNMEGNTCDAEVIAFFVDETETGQPSPSPDETPSPATSSGSCHAARVPIVVSAAVAVWMASFGT
jgi:hypothetical protein